MGKFSRLQFFQVSEFQTRCDLSLLRCMGMVNGDYRGDHEDNCCDDNHVYHGVSDDYHGDLS